MSRSGSPRCAPAATARPIGWPASPAVISVSCRPERVAAICGYVWEHVGYEADASGAGTDAVDTLLGGRGVCRDFAHLVAALCRAVEVPARIAAVYAPGLSPMDFHAVVETEIENRWYAWDATRLAPRPTLVRIATGRDATDIAFSTVLTGRAELTGLEITAVTPEDLPLDDHEGLVAPADAGTSTGVQPGPPVAGRGRTRAQVGGVEVRGLRDRSGRAPATPTRVHHPGTSERAAAGIAVGRDAGADDMAEVQHQRRGLIVAVTRNRQLAHRRVAHPREQVLRARRLTVDAQHELLLSTDGQHVEQTGWSLIGHHNRQSSCRH